MLKIEHGTTAEKARRKMIETGSIESLDPSQELETA